jgi:Protein of unknown function (DUF3024)
VLTRGAVTIVERRAPSRKDYGPEWTNRAVARLRYTAKSGVWTLYWSDRDGRWHRYDLIEPISGGSWPKGAIPSVESIPTKRYCCVMILEFDEHGNLPPGIHHATWTEIVTRYATSTRRRDLLDGLLDALRSLKTAGCGIAYLDGSFVTTKEHPADFDACWESAGVDLDRLDRLDAELLDFKDRRAAQKARDGGELFPTDWAASPDGMTFLDYFQHDRTTQRPKSIIAIDLTGLP